MQAEGDDRTGKALRREAGRSPSLQDTAAAAEPLGMRDVVECISRHVGEADLLAWKLSCRRFLAGAVACGRAEEKSPAGALVCSVARVGWAFGTGLPLRADQVIVRACEAGCVDVVAWARGRGFPMVDWACWAAAARGGQVEVMEYLLEEGVCWETEEELEKTRSPIPGLFLVQPPREGLGTCASAALHGRLAALQYAQRHGIPWDVSTLRAASREGHEAVVHWAVEQGCPTEGLESSLCMDAAVNGNLGCLQWMCRQGWEMDWKTLASAAGAGALDILRFAREQGVEWPLLVSSGNFAAAGGHAEVLRWMVEEGGYEWQGGECESAARGGHLGLLQWLRERGCAWGDTCREAARKGNLDLLMWARGEGAPWDASVCAAAAAGGHIVCLKWCRANGCEWHQGNLDGAALHGHVECLQWALNNGCPVDDPARLAAMAARDRSGQALRLCHACGIEWDGEVCAVLVEVDNLPLLRWARAQGAPWESDPAWWTRMVLARQAEFRGNLRWPRHVAQWARTHGLFVPDTVP